MVSDLRSSLVGKSRSNACIPKTARPLNFCHCSVDKWRGRGRVSIVSAAREAEDGGDSRGFAQRLNRRQPRDGVLFASLQISDDRLEGLDAFAIGRVELRHHESVSMVLLSR